MRTRMSSGFHSSRLKIRIWPYPWSSRCLTMVFPNEPVPPVIRTVLSAEAVLELFDILCNWFCGREFAVVPVVHSRSIEGFSTRAAINVRFRTTQEYNKFMNPPSLCAEKTFLSQLVDELNYQRWLLLIQYAVYKEVVHSIAATSNPVGLSVQN